MKFDFKPNFYLFLPAILSVAEAQGQHDFFFNKNVPDEETSLTEFDYQMMDVYKDNDPITVNDINNTAMYSPNRFEGDIANYGMNSHTISSFMTDGPPQAFGIYGVQRNAVRQTYLKWTDGRIPYTISSQYSSYSRSKIAEAIEEYRKKTCIDFAPKSAADQDYIHIVPDDGCYSLVGRIGRADRDDYVTINWSNVEAGLQDQFDKYSLNLIDHLDTKYDYGSVMHYSPTAFSKNGKPTIEPKEKGAEIGQRVGFSENDLHKINKLYNCPQLSTTPEPASASTTRVKSATKKPVVVPVKPGNGAIGTNSASGGGSTTNEKSGKPPKSQLILKRKCEDRRRDCEFLARAGHCDSRFSVRFMGENCPRSCNKCDASIEEEDNGCQDSRSWCERWANSGMCTQPIFQDYMKSKFNNSFPLYSFNLPELVNLFRKLETIGANGTYWTSYEYSLKPDNNIALTLHSQFSGLFWNQKLIKPDLQTGLISGYTSVWKRNQPTNSNYTNPNMTCVAVDLTSIDNVGFYLENCNKLLRILCQTFACKDEQYRCLDNSYCINKNNIRSQTRCADGTENTWNQTCSSRQEENDLQCFESAVHRQSKGKIEDLAKCLHEIISPDGKPFILKIRELKYQREHSFEKTNLRLVEVAGRRRTFPEVRIGEDYHLTSNHVKIYNQHFEEGEKLNFRILYNTYNRTTCYPRSDGTIFYDESMEAVTCDWMIRTEHDNDYLIIMIDEFTGHAKLVLECNDQPILDIKQTYKYPTLYILPYSKCVLTLLNTNQHINVHLTVTVTKWATNKLKRLRFAKQAMKIEAVEPPFGRCDRFVRKIEIEMDRRLRPRIPDQAFRKRKDQNIIDQANFKKKYAKFGNITDQLHRRMSRNRTPLDLLYKENHRRSYTWQIENFKNHRLGTIKIDGTIHNKAKLSAGHNNFTKSTVLRLETNSGDFAGSIMFSENCPQVELKNRLVMRGDNSYGSQVKFICPQDYTIIGNTFSECLVGGNWSHHIPTGCSASEKYATCPLPVLPFGRIVEVTPSPDAPYMWNKFYNGTTLQYNCSAPYYHIPGVSNTCVNGKWISEPQCRMLNCDIETNLAYKNCITSSKVQVTMNFNKLAYSMPSGDGKVYHHETRPIRVCKMENPGNTWIPFNFKLEERVCWAYYLNNGRFNRPAHYDGELADITCDNSCELIGNNYCKNGTWLTKPYCYCYSNELEALDARGRCPEGLVEYRGTCVESNAEISDEATNKTGTDCVNGHIIIWNDGTQVCNCSENYVPFNLTFCIFKCNVSDPCENGGECHYDNQGNETCKCKKYEGISAFEGEYCEILVDLCKELNETCNNHGKCHGEVAGELTCVCENNYYGDRCQYLRSSCDMNPCFNGAMCRDLENGTYHCDCTSGYKGEHCETPYCYCLHKGRLTRRPVRTPDSTNYICTCDCSRTNFTGDHCEIFACEKCDNGKCDQRLNQCVCNPGFEGNGTYCWKDDCRPDCNGQNGTWDDNNKTCICDCPQGQYFGDHCENCSNTFWCNDHGTCTIEDGINNNISCKCDEGYIGNNCSVSCSKEQCNAGIPNDQNGTCTCICPLGFYNNSDSNCVKIEDFCNATNCHNGKCNDTAQKCDCDLGYLEPFCIEYQCEQPNEVFDGSACVCNEDDGFYGPDCSLNAVNCSDILCWNGGTCDNSSIGSKRCICSPNWTGTNCSEPVNDLCTADFVNNCKGRCILNKTTNQPYCQCDEYHDEDGSHCTIRANVTEPNSNYTYDLLFLGSVSSDPIISKTFSPGEDTLKNITICTYLLPSIYQNSENNTFDWRTKAPFMSISGIENFEMSMSIYDISECINDTHNQNISIYKLINTFHYYCIYLKNKTGEYDLYMDGDNGEQSRSCQTNKTAPYGNEWNLTLAPRNDDNNLYVGYISEFRIYQGNINKRDMPHVEDDGQVLLDWSSLAANVTRKYRGVEQRSPGVIRNANCLNGKLENFTGDVCNIPTELCIDNQPPIAVTCPFYYPMQINTPPNASEPEGVEIPEGLWNNPIFYDDSGCIKDYNQNILLGQRFGVGTSIGIYEVTDGSGNRATCTFEMTVYRSSCFDTVKKLVAINGAIEIIDIKGPNVNMTVRVNCNDTRYPTPDKPEFFVCDSTGSWLYGEETNDDKIVLYKCGFTDMAEPKQILSESIMGFNTTCENMTETLSQTIIGNIPNCTIGKNCNVTMPLSCEGQDEVNANGTYQLAYRIELISDRMINTSVVDQLTYLNYRIVPNTTYTENRIECPEKYMYPYIDDIGRNGSLTRNSNEDILEILCVTCPPGKHLFYDDQNNTKCIDCERGTFYDNSTMSCVGCPDNKTTTGPGAAGIEYCIKNCSAGSFYNSTSDCCQPCRINYYQDQWGQRSCIPCGNGMCNDSPGQKSSTSCHGNCCNNPLTQYRNSGSGECSNCPYLTFTNGTYGKHLSDCNVIKCPEPINYYSACDVSNTSLACQQPYSLNSSSELCVRCGNIGSGYQKGNTSLTPCMCTMDPSYCSEEVGKQICSPNQNCSNPDDECRFHPSPEPAKCYDKGESRSGDCRCCYRYCISKYSTTGTETGVIIAVLITLIIIVSVGVWIYRAGMTIPPGIRKTSQTIFDRLSGQSVSDKSDDSSSQGGAERTDTLTTSVPDSGPKDPNLTNPDSSEPTIDDLSRIDSISIPQSESDTPYPLNAFYADSDSNKSFRIQNNDNQVPSTSQDSSQTDRSGIISNIWNMFRSPDIGSSPPRNEIELNDISRRNRQAMRQRHEASIFMRNQDDSDISSLASSVSNQRPKEEVKKYNVMDFVMTPNASPETSPQDTPYPTVRAERPQETGNQLDVPGPSWMMPSNLRRRRWERLGIYSDDDDSMENNTDNSSLESYRARNDTR
ncbi:hypothetical protein WR25_18947 isoform C [Diploscapter pachys]|uniref:Metalloendopeptidase n=1 Tax=Diploscapter pachys TaxID=2018661 RepID=A0A2A2K966_9BILA|nr:hypothetical protein WR25_18947 isoform C [Diploscapter pachys]